MADQGSGSPTVKGKHDFSVWFTLIIGVHFLDHLRKIIFNFIKNGNVKRWTLKKVITIVEILLTRVSIQPTTLAVLEVVTIVKSISNDNSSN